MSLPDAAIWRRCFLPPCATSAWPACAAYSLGMWHGVLTAAGFRAATVPVRAWKSDLRLLTARSSGSKEESRAVALQLFPHREEILRWFGCLGCGIGALCLCLTGTRFKQMLCSTFCAR